MVRIGPLSIGILGLAAAALLIPVAGGFVRAGGVAAAQRGGARIAGLFEDPVSGATGILGGLFEAFRRLGFDVGEDIRGRLPIPDPSPRLPPTLPPRLPPTPPQERICAGPGGQFFPCDEFGNPIAPDPSPPIIGDPRGGFRTRGPGGNIDTHDIFHRLVSSGPEHLTDAGHARLRIAGGDLSFQVRAFERGELSIDDLRLGFRQVVPTPGGRIIR